jgi:hypothetical protein
LRASTAEAFFEALFGFTNEWQKLIFWNAKHGNALTFGLGSKDARWQIAGYEDCCLCACPSFSKRLASIFDGSASLAGTSLVLSMKQLAASTSAIKLKSPSAPVEMGASFSLKAIQASLT